MPSLLERLCAADTASLTEAKDEFDARSYEAERLRSDSPDRHAVLSALAAAEAELVRLLGLKLREGERLIRCDTCDEYAGDCWAQSCSVHGWTCGLCLDSAVDPCGRSRDC